jgi:Uma2 family endonuclease
MARTPLIEEQVGSGPLILKVKNVGLTSEQFLQLCSDNRDLRFELTAQKELVIMPLPGANTSRRNIIITTELTIWARKDGTGITFDPACWFILPNGANRGPDAAWLKRERWEALTGEEKENGAPLCPEFVVELMSPSVT